MLVPAWIWIIARSPQSTQGLAIKLGAVLAFVQSSQRSRDETEEYRLVYVGDTSWVGELPKLRHIPLANITGVNILVQVMRLNPLGIADWEGLG